MKEDDSVRVGVGIDAASCNLLDIEEKVQCDKAAFGHVHPQKAGWRTVGIRNGEAVRYSNHDHGSEHLVHKKTAHQKRRKYRYKSPSARNFKACDAGNVASTKI